ncbi:MAG: hypothetical protein JXA01_05945, partial [Dehalococcoidia bacterium]|nr:hypothetical protein [Dehalococcoidia bacterium]
VQLQGFTPEDYRNKITHSKTAKCPFNPLKEEDIEQVRKVLPLMDYIARSLLQYEEDNLP